MKTCDVRPTHTMEGDTHKANAQYGAHTVEGDTHKANAQYGAHTVKGGIQAKPKHTTKKGHAQSLRAYLGLVLELDVHLELLLARPHVRARGRDFGLLRQSDGCRGGH